MALIRCPNCDTLHDLDGAMFASGPRKVRCANCREVWEASDPAATTRKAPVAPIRETIPEPAFGTNPLPDEPPDTNQVDFDSINFDAQPASQADVDSLFDSPPKPVENLKTEDKPIDLGPDPLDMPVQPVIPPTHDDDLEAAVQRRQAKRKKSADLPPPKPSRSSRIGSMAVVMMAASVGTLATLAIFRHETVRLAPETAIVFDSIGLAVNTRGLDIVDVRSRIVQEEARETLEIVGTIVNVSKSPQKIPVMRLSIRNQAGQDVYVWTATADQPELAPGEKTAFRRRLASPPAEGQAVMVRFVAKDDIVASIR